MAFLPKRRKMGESSNKMMKLTQTIPDDMVEHIISTFLPVKSLLRNRILSKRFVDTHIRSRNLDFSGIYSRRRSQLEVVGIIEEVFNQYKGSDIHRFILLINHLGIEDKIISCINTCLGKNIQEIVLDFSKSKKVMEIPINFSAVETLQHLKLRSCKFEMVDNSPKGLKLLRTLSLMRIKVMKETINAVFTNCIHLESVELINCWMDDMLSIHAPEHKKFKSLVLSSIRGLWVISLNAPSLENFKYDGYAIKFNFVSTYTLKEANLHYNRNFSQSYYDPSNLVVNNMNFITRVFVLTTTTIFLEVNYF
ncbi:FBD-associated F-box protein At1g61320 [Capsella rubella]|nr:FBD-associated F-box protein At1g61320 [Capsella rubella]